MKKTVVFALSLMLVVAAACKRAEQPATQTASARGATATQTQTSPTTQTTEGAAGTPMPEYTALNLDGSKFDLAAKRDKVVLLNVWATWCFPCRDEIPELQKLHDQYGPRGFEVVGVSVDESGADAVRQFVTDQKKMTYPIVLDPEGKIANLLQTSVLPTTILVDRKGQIVWKSYGAVEAGDGKLKKAIEASVGS